MPGGGLYKRVAQAATTARDGPDHLLQHTAEAKPAEPVVPAAEVEETAGPEEPEVCDVQAFTVWYWTEGPEPSFVPETMYMNNKEGGHKTGEPRLIVSLSSFEALSQAYVMSVEKEGVKAALLQEKEDLLQEVRVGYYKELQHLRELLDMAKEQMALARGVNRLEEGDLKRMEEFERQVKETDVHYFNIVEYLEPELKTIMKDAVKQFNKQLMLENYNLRDRLALHEGTEGEEGLAERLITLLMGKGTSPAEIAKLLSGMITDKEQSDDFFDACRGILGVSKEPLEKEQFKRNTVRPKQAASKEKPKEPEPIQEASPTSDSANARALMKELQDAKDAADKLREEQEAMMQKMKQQMEQQMEKFEREKAEIAAKLEEEKQKAMEADKAMKALQGKLEKALDDVEKAKAGVKIVHSEDTTPARRAREEEEDDRPARKKRAESPEDDTPSKRNKKRTESKEEPDRAKTPGGPSQRDLEEARKKAERAEAQLKELESRLREANKKISHLDEQLSKAQAEVEAARADAAEERRKTLLLAGQSSGPSTPTGDVSIKPDDSPNTRELKQKERSRMATPEESEELTRPSSEPVKPKKFVGKPMDFIDRDYSQVDRSGGYSSVSGKPIAIVEEELQRERKLRIGLEGETRKMTTTINDLGAEKFRLDKEVSRFTKDLNETKKKLQKLVEEDESDGVSDIQIFCRWLCRRYGSLENGFRALDANRSGGLSVYEFNQGLAAMGWIKIVGRRLFKIIDNEEKGEIEMCDLNRVYEKFVDGQQDDEQIASTLAAAEVDFKAQEKNDLEDARNRIRQLNLINNDLEDENKKLKMANNKAEMRAKSAKDGGEGMKGIERKCDLIKDSYDKLKSERDEVTSKMTAAMWKCREAHILQVKYMRQAELNQEELKKTNKKYEQLKQAYKRKNGVDVEEPGFEFSMAAGGSTAASIAQMSSALLTSPQMLKTFGSSFSIEEDTASVGGAVVTRPTTPGSPMSPAGDGGMRCPKCAAVLRIQPLPDAASRIATSFQHTSSKADLAKMLRAATRPQYDAATEAKLSQFEAAKQKGDFAAVDAMRDDLRAKGIDADVVTAPAVRNSQFGTIAPRPQYDTATEAKISQFEAAKQKGDFAAVDAMRNELSAKGIDADVVTAPAVRNPQYGMSAPRPQYDAATETKLVQFEAAKQNGDFAAVDAMRKELRSRGIDADIMVMASDGEESGNERCMSPEERMMKDMDNMTDEELLYGKPSDLSKQGGGGGMNMQGLAMSEASKRGAAYQQNSLAHSEKHGKKHRWQLLFADAQERSVGSGVAASASGMRPGSPDSPGSVTYGGMNTQDDGHASVILSQGSMNLLQHAASVRQRSDVWREAVPLEQSFAKIDASRREEERGAEALKIQNQAPGRAFGVGGCPVSSPSVAGRVYLGPPRGLANSPPALTMSQSQPIGGITASQSFSGAAGLRSSLGSPPSVTGSPPMASVFDKPSVSSGHAPPPPSFLEANNLSSWPMEGSAEGFFPVAEARTIKAASMVQEQVRKKQIQMDTLPADRYKDHGNGPSLSIVGNDSTSSASKLPNLESPPPTAKPAKAGSLEKRLPSPVLKGQLGTPPMTVTTFDAGPCPTFEEFDEGVLGQSLTKSSSVVGAWRKTFGKSGELTSDQSPPQALGAGIPTSPHDMRSPSLAKGGALKRVPAQLPTLNQSDVGRSGSKSLPTEKTLSCSMPDLGSQLRPVNLVRTPPLQASLDLSASPGRRVRTKKLSSALERVPTGPASSFRVDGGTSAPAPFEAPFLYVGNPPAPNQGQLAESLGGSRSHTTGASHTVPASLRNQFMMAASALELGSHVQRHAAAGEEVGPEVMDSPLIIQHPGASAPAAGVTRTLLS